MSLCGSRERVPLAPKQWNKMSLHYEAFKYIFDKHFVKAVKDYKLIQVFQRKTKRETFKLNCKKRAFHYLHRGTNITIEKNVLIMRAFKQYQGHKINCKIIQEQSVSSFLNLLFFSSGFSLNLQDDQICTNWLFGMYARKHPLQPWQQKSKQEDNLIRIMWLKSDFIVHM